MTRKIAEFIIKFWRLIGEELNRAFLETYGDYELAKEFAWQVNKIRKKNKQAYIESAIRLITNKELKINGYIITPAQATALAEIKFEEALIKGEIGILNEIVEK